MKKFLLVVLACLFALCSFAACSNGTPDDGDHNKPTPTPPEEQTKTVQDGGNYTVVGNYAIVTDGVAATAADPATAEVAFGKTAYYVSTDLNKILLVTAINNAEGLSEVSALGYVIDGFTAAEGDMAVTNKYFSTLTVGANAAKTAKDLALDGADEASKLLVWEIAYSAEDGLEFTAEATVGESTAKVTGTKADTKVKLTYMNGDETLGVQTLNYGQTADFSMIEIPSKAGYECVWTAENGTNLTATTPVTGNTVVSSSFKGIKIEEIAAAETMSVIKGDTLAVPADAKAVQSDFYKNEYTLAWKLGDTAITDGKIVVDDFIGMTVELVCVATHNENAEDVHTVYAKSYTFQEVAVYDLGDVYPTEGTVFYEIPYDRETYGAFKSSMLTNGDGSELGVWTSGAEEEVQTIFMKKEWFANGANPVTVRFENAVVHMNAYNADRWIGDFETLQWINDGGSFNGIYTVLTADIELKANKARNFASWIWMPSTLGRGLANHLDGAGHKITMKYTQEAHDQAVADNNLTGDSAVYSSLYGVLGGASDGIVIKNVYFDIDCETTKVAYLFWEMNSSVTFENCVFDVSFPNSCAGCIDGYIFKDDCTPTIKNCLFINSGTGVVSVSMSNLASLENCVFVNMNSVSQLFNAQWTLCNVFNVAENSNTSFWVFDTVENAIAGTFADESRTGYGTAPADGAASFSHGADDAKTLEEIFEDTGYLTVTSDKVTWGDTVIWQKTAE